MTEHVVHSERTPETGETRPATRSGNGAGAGAELRPGTRGPWRWLGPALIQDSGRRSVVLIASRDHGIQTRGDDGQLRAIDPDEPLALLIAATPDLLEAAKHAAMEWRLHGQLTDSCRVLEAAIAKAEGSAR